MAWAWAACPELTASAPTPPSRLGDALLEDVAGGVHDAGVDVAGFLQREEPGGVIGVLEHVRGGLVDGHGAGAGDRVGLLPGMQLPGGETKGTGDFLWGGHGNLSGNSIGDQWISARR